MKTSLSRFLIAAACAQLGAGLALAQNTVTVPRSEYEQLKSQLEQMQLRLDTMAAPANAAQPAAAAAEAPRSSWRRGLDFGGFRPGWERYRSDDWSWMDSDRVEDMNVRVAGGEGFSLFAGMTSSGRFQALQQKNVAIAGKVPAKLEPGFQTAWGSFEFLADFDRNLEVYFDVYMSTKAHPSQLQGHEGYMLMRSAPDALAGVPGLKQLFNVANVKAGQFDIDFGDHRYRRSDNARGQRNSFVGNTIFDPSATEIGVEVYSKPGMLNWLVGAGSGSESGSFEAGRNMGMHGKTWLNLESLRLAASAYYLDHDLAAASFSNLFRASRSGGQYNGVFDNGNAPGNIFTGVGKQLTAYQVDATWYNKNYEIYGHLGQVTEKAPTGYEKWYYGTIDGVLRLTPRLYLDARYNLAMAHTLRGFLSDGRVQRIQVGGGYWLYKPVLFKLEYVNEKLSNFLAREGNVSGVEAWRSPSFQGVIAEFTFAY